MTTKNKILAEQLKKNLLKRKLQKKAREEKENTIKLEKPLIPEK